MAKKSEDDDVLVDKKDEYLVDSVPKTYKLMEQFWDTLNVNLSKNHRQLVQFIASYRNKYIQILETPYPARYPHWTPNNIKILYQVTGIDEEEFTVTACTIRGPDEYEDKYMADKAYYLLLNMIVKWFKMKKMTKEITIVEHYIGYSYYWAVFTRYFKYPPDPNLIKTTIDNMSYKNNLKALGSVDMWLYKSVDDSLITYAKRLDRASDWEIYYISDKIRSKFDGYMKNIFRAWDETRKNKEYTFSSKTIKDEVISDNTFGVAEVISLADNYTTKFFSDPVSERALTDAIMPGGITKRDLRNTILLIADDNANLEDVRKFYQSLFHLFLDNTKYKTRDIGTLRFYQEMQKLYRPGNSNDPNKNFIKDILDKWLAEGSSTFRATNRAATMTTFRKSIYEYFIRKILQDH